MLPFPSSFKVIARSKVQDTVVVVIEAIASSFSYCSPHDSLALTSLPAISPPPAPVPGGGAAVTSPPAAPAAAPLHSLSHLSVNDVALIESLRVQLDKCKASALEERQKLRDERFDIGCLLAAESEKCEILEVKVRSLEERIRQLEEELAEKRN